MKKFCKSLRKYAIKIINFKKKNMELSTKEMQNYVELQKSVIFEKKKSIIKI